eukprot:CAMPEP_0118725484 /NCGR_PEP_ID=MMETSP0800-20121206/33166_1 /TAXON_ID=210618 ORGANISM="Striatella unipunctata, Strain CCMP2910" /NCGR_SAMPLE_ID=MMETSP0800 /ASSEMBLY_ACC=CAM_ASM_000638 /LENGTH=195 /DNA_ID=CAMNT_0006634189 /DNA_START=1345 /DNA_END=1932 /DNA_ORIENTATION=+
MISITSRRTIGRHGCNRAWITSTRKNGKSPLEILGLSKSATFSMAKAKFLELAMQNHPDSIKSESDKKRAVEKFIEIREAFESLVESKSGELSWSTKEEEKLSQMGREEWFRGVTGHTMGDFMSRLQNHQIRELIEVSETMNPGGLDKGGMWQLAAMMKNQAQKHGMPPAEIAASSGSDREKRTDVGRGRRRRKK